MTTHRHQVARQARPRPVGNPLDARLRVLEQQVWWLRLWVGMGVSIIAGLGVLAVLLKVKGVM